MKMLLLFLITLVLISIIFLKSDFFKIHSIEVSLNKITCADLKTVKEKSQLLNKNIFLIDDKNISEDLKNKFICIKSIKLEKSPPSKIKINLQGREALAELLQIKDFEASASSQIENIATPSASQTETFLVDDEAVIFAKGNFLDLPKIYILGESISIGRQFKDDYLIKILSILKDLKDLQLQNPKVYVLNNLLVTQSQPKIIFRLDQDKNIQIASLQLILQKAKIDNEDLEFIDLRFDKPIVRFAPKKK